MRNAEMHVQTVPQGVIVKVAAKISRVELHNFGEFKRMTLTMLNGEVFQYDSHTCEFDFNDAVAKLEKAINEKASRT